MKTELQRRRLYREAFALLERANDLLLKARAKHEAHTQKDSSLKKAA